MYILSNIVNALKKFNPNSSETLFKNRHKNKYLTFFNSKIAKYYQ